MSDWISVEDKLPDVGQRVLVVAYGWDDCDNMYLGRLDPGWLKADPDGKRNFWGVLVAPSDWRLSGWSYLRDPDVRYWTPLPKAPTKEES
jgi:hypothetical protein|nr:MAG TPA: Protein of unknown function (DUF551) [Caudoviricetes sp.]